MSFAGRGRLGGIRQINREEGVMSSTRTRISKVGTVVVPVSDQERAIEFYVGTLGFEKRTDVLFGNSYRWVEVAPAGGVTTIAIVPPPPGKPTGGVETGISLSTDDVDADHADLLAAGVDVDAEISRMGDPVPPMFWFRDPDGNSLLVVEDAVVEDA
jgi:catechol 2,3-dioxygenase-like lactoylglutathione lyase family enzyme